MDSKKGETVQKQMKDVSMWLKKAPSEQTQETFEGKTLAVLGGPGSVRHFLCGLLCVCVSARSASCGLWLGLPPWLSSSQSFTCATLSFCPFHTTFTATETFKPNADGFMTQTVQRHNAEFNPSCPCVTQWHHSPVWIVEAFEDGRVNSVDTLLNRVCTQRRKHANLLVRFMELRVNMVQFIKLDRCGFGRTSLIFTTRARLRKHLNCRQIVIKILAYEIYLKKILNTGMRNLFLIKNTLSFNLKSTDDYVLGSL